MEGLWRGTGREGGTDSLSFGTKCKTTVPIFDKGQPLFFCHLKIYSPLFPWMPKNSPSGLGEQLSDIGCELVMIVTGI